MSIVSDAPRGFDAENAQARLVFQPNEEPEVRAKPAGKSVAAFRTISEVSSDINVPQHVLRFWESKFTQLRPLKRGGGRRYYRPEDVALLRRIHALLYNEGYTIKGVQRLLRSSRKTEKEETVAEVRVIVAEPPILAAPKPAASASDLLLRELLSELKMLRKLIV